MRVAVPLLATADVQLPRAYAGDLPLTHLSFALPTRCDAPLFPVAGLSPDVMCQELHFQLLFLCS